MGERNGKREVANGIASPLQGRALRVVVTGGSSGIGRQIVKAFASAGHLVFFTYLVNQKSAALLVKQYSPRVNATQLDQGRFDSVCAFADEVGLWCGEHGVDVLINNAAVGTATVVDYVSRTYEQKKSQASVSVSATKPVSLDDHCLRQAAEDDAMMRVNALGPLWVTRRLNSLVEMAAKRRQRGIIIFIGSIGGGGPVPFPGHRPADGMGKAASCQLAKQLAAEHVRDEIDVFCVNPGATDTKMFSKSTLDKVIDKESFIDRMPKRKLILPEEIASLVFWLSTSRESGILHGGVVDASMGLGVRPGLQTEMIHDGG